MWVLEGCLVSGIEGKWVCWRELSLEVEEIFGLSLD
jgi:hypothetical protein